MIIHNSGVHTKVILDEIVYAEVFNRKVVIHKLNGEIEYYEYCMSETEKIDECKWEKTNTKNMTASTTGKYYVVFRGVNNNKKLRI